MGDSSGPSVDPSVYGQTPGAIYQTGSAGDQAKLADWQKVSPYGAIPRAQRDAYVTAYKNNKLTPGILGSFGDKTINLNPSNRGQNPDSKTPVYSLSSTYNNVVAANAYEDSLDTALAGDQKIEQTQAQLEQQKLTAQRTSDLARANAVEGAPNNQGSINRGTTTPIGAAAPQTTLLTAPLGIPGGSAATGKTLLGS